MSIKVGDTVMIKYWEFQDEIGKVVDIIGPEYVVALYDIGKYSFEESDLMKMEEEWD